MLIRKVAIGFIASGVMLLSAAAPALAKNVNQGGDEDKSTHLKATICHWAHGNLSEPSVSLDAVKVAQDTGHGLLTLGDDETFVSFVPHTETGGHEQDEIIDVYWKKGNDITFTYQANTLCNPAPTTTTTQPPVTTTTTEPPVVTTTTQPPVVTTTTQPPVVTTTTQPPVTVTTVPEVPTTTQPPVRTAPPVEVTPVPEVPATPVAEVPVVPVAGGGEEEIAFGGAWSSLLAMIGAGIGLLGIGFRLLGRSLRVPA